MADGLEVTGKWVESSSSKAGYMFAVYVQMLHLD